jgi:gliding motility-associated-like protein
MGNNTLRPYLYGYSKVNYFKIYDRYGQLLYSANSNLPGWDGTIKGKPASTQTVVWMIEAVDAYGRVEKRHGTSILLR